MIRKKMLEIYNVYIKNKTYFFIALGWLFMSMTNMVVKFLPQVFSLVFLTFYCFCILLSLDIKNRD